jgi:hypothetical protein
MIKFIVPAATGLLLATGVAPALAQDRASPTGPGFGYAGIRAQSTIDFLFTDAVRASAVYKTGSGIARCMVGIGGDKAADLIGDPDTPDKAYRDLGRALQRRYASCVREDGVIPPMIVHYGLAEALLLREEGPGLDDRAPSVNVDEADAFSGVGPGTVTMDSIARCLAVYSPGLASKVVRSDVGSSDEAASLEALYARTPECGVSAPPETIPAAFQRGSVAVALYQWTHRAG